jgi:flagellar hook-length control protein FliK
MGVSADGTPRSSSGAQRALQMLLAEAGRTQGSGAVNANSTLGATGTGAASPASPTPSVPSPEGAGIGTDAQRNDDSRAPATLDGGPGTTTSAAAPSSTLATASTLTTGGAVSTASTATTVITASTPPTASTPSGASALDAANALNPAGAALTDGVRSAAATHLASTGGSNNLASLQSELRAAVGTTEWADELGGQLTWMAHHSIGSASLKVSPPDLGPIEVRIAVHGSAASVWFGAAQADTRTALEQALPRLHELFGAQGLALADASVSRESPREQRESPSGAWGGTGAAPAPADSVTQGAAALQHLGLLDLYA